MHGNKSEKKHEMYFSFIIPARDGVERLQRLLSSLAAHLQPGLMHEVIVVDDGSIPELSGQLTGFEGRVIRLDTSHGPAHARNVGAKEAKGGVLFFLDADVVYEAGAAEKALSILDGHPDVGAVSFLNQPYDAQDGVVANFGAAMEFFWHVMLVPEGEDFGECSGFTTRNGAVRREVFEAIHGFDTRYRTNAHEDYDIGRRLEAHSRTVIAGSPRLYHAFPARLSRIARNYWVRTSLFVPYFLRFRPKMSATQVTGSEAALRLSAAAPLGLLFLACVPLPVPITVRLGLLAGAAALAGFYAYQIRAFLSACQRWSGSTGFAVSAFALHYLTSLFILAGGVYGLWLHVRGSGPKELLSPIP